MTSTKQPTELPTYQLCEWAFAEDAIFIIDGSFMNEFNYNGIHRGRLIISNTTGSLTREDSTGIGIHNQRNEICLRRRTNDPTTSPTDILTNLTTAHPTCSPVTDAPTEPPAYPSCIPPFESDAIVIIDDSEAKEQGFVSNVIQLTEQDASQSKVGVCECQDKFAPINYDIINENPIRITDNDFSTINIGTYTRRSILSNKCLTRDDLTCIYEFHSAVNIQTIHNARDKICPRSTNDPTLTPTDIPTDEPTAPPTRSLTADASTSDTFSKESTASGEEPQIQIHSQLVRNLKEEYITPYTFTSRLLLSENITPDKAININTININTKSNHQIKSNGHQKEQSQELNRRQLTNHKKINASETYSLHKLVDTMASIIIANHWGITYYDQDEWVLKWKGRQIKHNDTSQTLKIPSGEILTLRYTGPQAYNIITKVIPTQPNDKYG